MLQGARSQRGAYLASLLSAAFAFFLGFFSPGLAATGAGAWGTRASSALGAGLAGGLAAAGAGLAFLPLAGSAAALVFLFFSWTVVPWQFRVIIWECR